MFLFHHVVRGSRYPPPASELQKVGGSAAAFPLRRYPILFSIAPLNFTASHGGSRTAILSTSRN